MSALGHVRIIELAHRVAGEYCGKLLADFGAEIIKVEPPGGSPTRALSPFAGDKPGIERSGLFAYLNTNKRSIVLDLDAEVDRNALTKLIDRADAVIDDHAAGWLAGLGVAASASLTVCSITPFGLDAPAERGAAEDLTVLHASGWGYHTPSAADAALPPLKGPGRFLPSYEAGLEAAMCVTAALLGAARGGGGRAIDVSMQAVLASRIDYVLGQMIAGDMDVGPERTRFDLGGPAGIFPCRDGFIYVFMSAPAHWQGFRRLVGDPPALAALPDNWLERGLTDERIALTRRHLVDWLAGVGKDEAAAAAQREGVTLVPVNDASDLLRSPQLAHRGFFTQVDHPTLGRVRHPGVPYRLSATPARIERPAPALGEMTA